MTNQAQLARLTVCRRHESKRDIHTLCKNVRPFQKVRVYKFQTPTRLQGMLCCVVVLPPNNQPQELSSLVNQTLSIKLTGYTDEMSDLKCPGTHWCLIKCEYPRHHIQTSQPADGCESLHHVIKQKGMCADAFWFKWLADQQKCKLGNFQSFGAMSDVNMVNSIYSNSPETSKQGFCPTSDRLKKKVKKGAIEAFRNLTAGAHL